MAWADTALVQTVAAANGTNNYVLSNPASQGPLRTDLQAEADGSLANGDLVHYMVRRITTTGDAEFERGYGAWTKSTRVLARTAGNVLDSDGGPGVLKDWGLSGQMDVYFLPPLDGSDIPSAVHADFATNLGLPRLAAANTFTADQTVKVAGSIGRLQVGSTGTGSFPATFDLLGGNSAAESIRYTQLRQRITDSTDGSEDGRLEILVSVAGALTEVARFTSNGVEDGSGNKYDAFPSGTPLLFGAAPPAGWTRSNETQSRVIRLAKSGDTIGATGGSDDLFDGSWQTAAHTLALSEVPDHSHLVEQGQFEGQSGTGFFSGTNQNHGGGGNTVNSESVGGGGSHSHNMTTPHYFIACWATKD